MNEAMQNARVRFGDERFDIRPQGHAMKSNILSRDTESSQAQSTNTRKTTEIVMLYTGGPDVLQNRERQHPPPRADEVRVRVCRDWFHTCHA